MIDDLVEIIQMAWALYWDARNYRRCVFLKFEWQCTGGEIRCDWRFEPLVEELEFKAKG
jgi:hypothetical protein